MAIRDFRGHRESVHRPNEKEIRARCTVDVLCSQQRSDGQGCQHAKPFCYRLMAILRCARARIAFHMRLVSAFYGSSWTCCSISSSLSQQPTSFSFQNMQLDQICLIQAITSLQHQSHAVCLKAAYALTLVAFVVALSSIVQIVVLSRKSYPRCIMPRCEWCTWPCG